MLQHEPTTKDRRFGHFGTVVEQCVQAHKQELLEFLLSEGARVEQVGRLIIVRAVVCGVTEDSKQLLVRYGATTDFHDEEKVETEAISSHQENDIGNASWVEGSNY